MCLAQGHCAVLLGLDLYWLSDTSVRSPQCHFLIFKSESQCVNNQIAPVMF